MVKEDFRNYVSILVNLDNGRVTCIGRETEALAHAKGHSWKSTREIQTDALLYTLPSFEMLSL